MHSSWAQKYWWGDFRMQQQTGQTASNTTTIPSNNMQQSLNHGGHDVFDVHEIISGTISLIDQHVLLTDSVKDPELKDILTRQHQFILDQYNIIVESFSTGQDPSKPTGQYKMQQSNDVIYGLKPSGQPKKPAMSTADITDDCIANIMLCGVKSAAGAYTKAALEVTNPVVRRVIADSTPNLIEMAYEIFLYQNKNGNYQVPQLASQDMTQMINSYTTVNKQRLQ